MTSATATLPVGPMGAWCSGGFNADPTTFFHPEQFCANSTRAWEWDSISICCDGDIINSRFDMGAAGVHNETYSPYILEDMVCCRQAGRISPGGIGPIPSEKTRCASGTPSPLASMAATNTDNAQNFLVTYISASEAGTSLADWTTTSTPQCMWMATSGASGTTEVVLPRAEITTLSSSESKLPTAFGGDPPTVSELSLVPGFTAETTGAMSTGRLDTSGILTESSTSSSQAPSASSSPAENSGSAARDGSRLCALWMLLTLSAGCQILGAA